MYVMTMIDLAKSHSVKSCREWAEKLIEEQRIVLTVPDNMIVEACRRIKAFCEKHYRN
jgi:hypothetical protein